MTDDVRKRLARIQQRGAQPKPSAGGVRGRLQSLMAQPVAAPQPRPVDTRPLAGFSAGDPLRTDMTAAPSSTDVATPSPPSDPPLSGDGDKVPLALRLLTLGGAPQRGAYNATAQMVRGTDMMPLPIETRGLPPAAQEILRQGQREIHEDQIGRAMRGETPAAKFADLLEDEARRQFPGDERVREGFANQALEGLGSTAPYIASSIAAGPMSPVVMGGLGILGGEGELLQDAARRGATPEEVRGADQRAIIAGGAIEAIPIERALGRLVPKAWKGRIVDIIMGAGEEGLQEGVQTITQNFAARSYDEQRELLAGMKESAQVGGATGAMLNAIIAMLGGKVRRPGTSTTEDADLLPVPADVGAAPREAVPPSVQPGVEAGAAVRPDQGAGTTPGGDTAPVLPVEPAGLGGDPELAPDEAINANGNDVPSRPSDVPSRPSVERDPGGGTIREGTSESAPGTGGDTGAGETIVSAEPGATTGDGGRSRGVDDGPPATEEEYYRRVADSEDAGEVLDAYLSAESYAQPEGTPEDVVAKFFEGGGRITRQTFDAFGDPNVRKDTERATKGKMGRAYFRSGGKRGAVDPDSEAESLDTLAAQLSSEAGTEITPQHIVDFIAKHADGSKGFRTNPLAEPLARRYEELTGKKITPKTIEKRRAEMKEIEAEVEPDQVADLVDDFLREKGYTRADGSIDYDRGISDYFQTQDQLDWTELMSLTEAEYAAAKKHAQQQATTPADRGRAPASTSQDEGAPRRDPEGEGSEEVDGPAAEVERQRGRAELGLTETAPVMPPAPAASTVPPEPAGTGEATAAQGINPEKLEKSAKAYLQRYFTSRGDIPEDAFRGKVRRDGRIKSIERRVKFTLGDFRRAAKEAYGGDVPAAEVRRIDDVLKGQSDVETLPGPLQEPVRAMRRQIDAMSDLMIQTGAAEGDLALTVEANKGVYVTRTYRVFEDPKWAENVPEEIRNKAKAFIRKENPDLGDNEVEGLIEALLYREQSSPFGALASRKLGSKDLSITKRRKDIVPEIRALLGEITDPRTNYVRSMMRMAQVVANQELLNEVRVRGLGTFLFERPAVDGDVKFNAQIAAEGSRTMSPLNGLYTTPEIKQAFENIDAGPDGGRLLETYMKALSTVKAAKTVFSVQTQIRNYLGNILFAIANGHWRINKKGAALSAVGRNLRNLGTEEQRREWQRLLSLGVIDESVGVGELEDMFRDASFALEDPVGYNEHVVWRVTKASVRGAQKLYRTADDVWKLYAFYNEKARYQKALPDVSEAEIEQMAADIIRNGYPTYSLVPEAIKILRRSPIVGSFVSFAAEIPRITYHTIAQTKKELSTPGLRSIGLQRAGGVIIAGMAPVLISSTARALMGMTQDDDEAVRRFVPPWEKNSELLYYGHTEDGNLKYADVSYLNPYSYIRDPVYALLSNLDDTDPMSATMEATKVAFEPFLGEEILTQAVLDVARNKRSNGGEVYNEQAPQSVQLRQVTSHILRAFEPGTISSLRRISDGLAGRTNVFGTARDPKTESVALFTGMRLKELDARQALGYNASRFSSSYRDATRIFTTTLTKRGRVTEEEIRDAYFAMESSRRELFGEAVQDARAAMLLGVDEKEIRSIFDNAGLSQENAHNVVKGAYRPYSNPAILRSRIKAVREAGRTADEAELRRREEIARSLLKAAASDKVIPTTE